MGCTVKTLPKLMLILVVLGIVSVVSTGISLQGFGSIEDGIIKGSVVNNDLFESIKEARDLIISTNLLGLLIIAFLWHKCTQKKEQN